MAPGTQRLPIRYGVGFDRRNRGLSPERVWALTGETVGFHRSRRAGIALNEALRVIPPDLVIYSNISLHTNRVFSQKIKDTPHPAGEQPRLTPRL
jgi:hypothetical protein